MRSLTMAALALLIGCGPAPAPVASPKPDATQEPWYGQTVSKLGAMNRDAESLFHGGRMDEAAALVINGESLADRLLAVPRPTLAALEAASDVDDLYGRMLLSNHNYGWARLEFQKNRARWKSWQPQTPETAVRVKQADSAIAECDRHMTE